MSELADRFPQVKRVKGFDVPEDVLLRAAAGGMKTDVKVGLVVAGAQRGGTTALHNYISRHPEVCSSSRKEVHYFDTDANFEGEPDYRDYHVWFDPRPEHKVLFEATAMYMHSRKAPGRIQAYNPDMKIVIILRNPIDRAYSHWNLHRRKGREEAGFIEALERYVQQYQEENNAVGGLLGRASYTEQVKRLWSLFPKEQVLILRNEELREHAHETLGRIFDFAGLSPFRFEKFNEGKTAEYEEGMPESARDFLRDFYRDEIVSLEELLGWDCSAWRA